MYKGLSRAQLSFDYLHTNSTTHEFLFGALAELLDNARDAYATKINIHSVSDSTLRGGYMLCFLDDGQGMSPEEASDIITFGKSTKKSLDSHMIGKYGNGLKSGSMRIGNDLMLFTKKDAALTCVFLSRTFHEREQLEEIIVPMPSFDAVTKRPLAKTPREKEKHVQEMELILKYSPFKTDAQFMKEFDKIEGTSGTLVIVYNLKLLDTGEPELDVKTDTYDILLSSPYDDSNEGLLPERKSFRSYASILYVDPHMRVYIQGKKVRTKRIVSTLYKPRSYRFTSARFKARSEKEVKKADEDARNAEFRAREAESKAKDLEIKLGMMPDKEQRIELRRAQTHALELRKEAQLRKAIAERKNKSLKEPKQLVFVFGINLENRSRDGVFVYNCSRLIKMYQKIGPQLDGGVLCNGVVGVVDAPYLVLEPTHNKQDFADAKEYRHLQQAMGEHMLQYWRDIDIAQQGVSKFWENFGYISPNWHALPSADPKYIRKRTAQVQITLQCDLCLKWRIIPYSSNNINKVFPDDWVCSMNPDPAHNRCSAPEEKPNLPEGILKKMPKTKEQKEKDLEEEIKKKQSQLDRMQHKAAPKRRIDSSPSSLSSFHSDDAESSSHGSDARGSKQKRGFSGNASELESNSSKKPTISSEPAAQKGSAHRPSQSTVQRPPPSSLSSQRPARSFVASLSSAPSAGYKAAAPSNKFAKSHQHSVASATAAAAPKQPSRQSEKEYHSKPKSPSARHSHDASRHRKRIRKSTNRSDSDSDDDEARRGSPSDHSPAAGDDNPDDDDYSIYSERMSEKRKKLSTPSATYEKKNSKIKEKPKSISTLSNRSLQEDEDFPRVDKRAIGSERRASSPVAEEKDRDEVDLDDDDDEEEEQEDDSVECSQGDRSRRMIEVLTLGKKVKAMVQKFWIEGEVVEENMSRDKCRVQFTNSFHGITDMWFSKASHDIQIPDDTDGSVLDGNESSMLDASANETNGAASFSTAPEESLLRRNGLKEGNGCPSSPTTESSPNGSAEKPAVVVAPVASSSRTFSTSATNTTFNLNAYEEIANGFRTCLRYFLPPQWYMDKETVSSLGVQDLSAFPLDDFFDQYEKGLRKLVSSFQHEAQVKQCEAEQSSGKLSTVRRMIAKLLKTINEDFEIDSECDTDEVDDLLALCLRQALEHARGSAAESN